MKVLFFQCRGETFKVNERGELTQAGNGDFSGGWHFIGISSHHWHSHTTTSMLDGFNSPESLVGGLVWDNDHGTTRRWAGQYLGKLPRITAAWVKEEEAIK